MLRSADYLLILNKKWGGRYIVFFLGKNEEARRNGKGLKKGRGRREREATSLKLKLARLEEEHNF